MSRQPQYHNTNPLIPGNSFTIGWHGEAVLVTLEGERWSLHRGNATHDGPVVVPAERWETAVARITAWLDERQVPQGIRRAAS